MSGKGKTRWWARFDRRPGDTPPLMGGERFFLSTLSFHVKLFFLFCLSVWMVAVAASTVVRATTVQPSPQKTSDKNLPSDVDPATLLPSSAVLSPALGDAPQKTVPLVVSYHDNDDLLLTFQGYHGRAATVFVDQGVLFCVFDTPIPLDLTLYKKAIVHPKRGKAFFIRRMDHIPVPNGTVVAFTLTGRVGGSLSHHGEGIQLHLHDDDSIADRDLQIHLQVDHGAPPENHQVDNRPPPGQSQGERLWAAIPDGRPVITWSSDMTGGFYGAIPTETGGVHHPIVQGDFTLLSTTRGVAFKTYTDGVVAERQGEGILWRRDGGLNITPASDRSMGRKGTPLPPWMHVPTAQNKESFFNAWHGYLQQITTLDKDKRLNKRLEMARFLMGYGLAFEASSMLSHTIVENPKVFLDPRIRALKGVSLALAGRAATARRILSYFDGTDDPDMRLWQGYSDMKRGFLQGGFDMITAHDRTIKAYPDALRIPLSLDGAHGAAALGKPGMWFLDTLNVKSLSVTDQDRYHLERAHFLLEKGKQRAAATEMTHVKNLLEQTRQADMLFLSNALQNAKNGIKGIDGPSKDISVQLAYPSLPPTAALRQRRIDLLEQVRFFRRGDDFEKNTLFELARLYGANGRLEDALTLLRQILDYFPGTPEKQWAQHLAESMLYQLIHSLDQAPALKVLGIYAKFQDLAPQDRRRFDLNLIRADQYLDLDLLDRARNILLADGQDTTMPPAARAQHALRLAFIAYREGNPTDGLIHFKTVDKYKTDLPKSSRHKATFLKARLYSALGRYGDALSLLGTEPGLDSLYFQVQILRSIGQYQGARDLLRAILAHTQGDSKRAIVVQLAITLLHLKDRDGLNDLRQTYGAIMDQSPERDLFRILTDGENHIPADHQAMVNYLKGAEAFEQSLRRISPDSSTAPKKNQKAP